MRQTTCKMGQDETRDVRSATGNRRLATRSMQRDETRRGLGDRQRTPCGMGHWGLGQQAADQVGHATKKGHADTIQRTACRRLCRRRPLESVQQTTENMQHAPGKMQRTTATQQSAACNRHRGISKRSLTTGNKATRQHAACSRHRAEDGKTRQRMQQATCNIQQTRCKRTRAHARCNKETHGIAAFPVRRAGGSGQAAACAKHCSRHQCATRHRRHAQDGTYDRCRSMQQTHAEPTPRRRH